MPDLVKKTIDIVKALQPLDSDHLPSAIPLFTKAKQRQKQSKSKAKPVSRINRKIPSGEGAYSRLIQITFPLQSRFLQKQSKDKSKAKAKEKQNPFPE